MSEDFPKWFRKRKNSFLNIFEEIEKMMISGILDGSIKERKLPDGSKIRGYGPFIYGYSIRMGPDGKPEIEEFGNIKPPRSPQPFKPLDPDIPFLGENEGSNKKELIVDIYTKNNIVKVICEIPGVQESDIGLHCTEKKLTILVNDEKIREIEIPVKVDPKNSKLVYKNGILEVTLFKDNSEKEGNESSKITWGEV